MRRNYCQDCLYCICFCLLNCKQRLYQWRRYNVTSYTLSFQHRRIKPWAYKCRRQVFGVVDHCNFAWNVSKRQTIGLKSYRCTCSNEYILIDFKCRQGMCFKKISNDNNGPFLRSFEKDYFPKFLKWVIVQPNVYTWYTIT